MKRGVLQAIGLRPRKRGAMGEDGLRPTRPVGCPFIAQAPHSDLGQTRERMSIIVENW